MAGLSLSHFLLICAAVIFVVDSANVRRFVNRMRRENLPSRSSDSAGSRELDENTCWWQGRTYDANINEQVSDQECKQKCIDAGDLDGQCVRELDECLCKDGAEEWRNYFDPIVIPPN